MKRLITILGLGAIIISLGGCFVVGPRRGYKSCGPAYHWDGGRCVHNGRGYERREERRERREERHEVHERDHSH